MAASDHISSKGMGYRAAGCVVWVDIQLAATCFALRPLVRRENASPDVDLSTAYTVRWCGGRCLRRSRAPWARRERLQRVWSGCGMSCGRSCGDRVRAGAIYSHFMVEQKSFVF